MSSPTDTIIKTYRTALKPAWRDGSPPAQSSTLFQRLSSGEHTAAVECVNAYGAFVWTLAKKNLRSTEEAEKVCQEIFTDIWAFAKTAAAGDEKYPEVETVRRIAVRRIIKHRFETRNTF